MEPLTQLAANTAKNIAKKAAQSFFYRARKEEERDTMIRNIVIGILAFFLFITSLAYIFNMPNSQLSDYFGGDIHLAEVLIDEHASDFKLYGSNGGMFNNNYDFGDWEDYNALDPERFKNLMNVATQYVGWPYVWGGSKPSTSFDCSGFIYWCFNSSGVYEFPRTTAQGIYEMSVSIPIEEARAGDLVFFHSTYETDREITHIGIYLGDGQMIHAGSPIGYANVNSSFWSRHFHSFGRFPTDYVGEEI